MYDVIVWVAEYLSSVPHLLSCLSCAIRCLNYILHMKPALSIGLGLGLWKYLAELVAAVTLLVGSHQAGIRGVVGCSGLECGGQECVETQLPDITGSLISREHRELCARACLVPVECASAVCHAVVGL